MGLINKIEDKLSSNKSSNTEPQTYESNSSGAPSNIRHPISSNQGTSPTVGATNTADRDGYGTQPSKYNTTTNSGYGQQPGSYQTDTRTAPTGHGNDTMPTTTTNTTTSTNTDQRQYYDPYSRKGQQTAASAATDRYGMSPSTGNNTSPNADANVARSHRGGVLNSNDDPRYGTQHHGNVSATGNQDMGTMSGEPASRHHYGRDAGMGAGAGAAGVGAYEMGKSDRHPQEAGDSRYPREGDTSRYPQEMGTSNHPNYSHVQPAGGHVGATNATGHLGGGSGMENSMQAPTQAQKMSQAYEAGYKDAVEHMKKEHQHLMQKYES
jgi:hypothetical protein